MTQLYECESCGVIQPTTRDLCKPRFSEVSCYTSNEIGQEKMSTICDPMDQKMLFSCSACMRSSTDRDLLCSPMPHES